MPLRVVPLDEAFYLDVKGRGHRARRHEGVKHDAAERLGLTRVFTSKQAEALGVPYGTSFLDGAVKQTAGGGWEATEAGRAAAKLLAPSGAQPPVGDGHAEPRVTPGGAGVDAGSGDSSVESPDPAPVLTGDEDDLPPEVGTIAELYSHVPDPADQPARPPPSPDPAPAAAPDPGPAVVPFDALPDPEDPAMVAAVGAPLIMVDENTAELAASLSEEGLALLVAWRAQCEREPLLPGERYHARYVTAWRRFLEEHMPGWLVERQSAAVLLAMTGMLGISMVVTAGKLPKKGAAPKREQRPAAPPPAASRRAVPPPPVEEEETETEDAGDPFAGFIEEPA